ncbi:unnamed protein product [Ectocarpus sp. 13 AM-2016]
MATCMAECGGWKRLEHLDRFGLAVPVRGIFGISPKVPQGAGVADAL